MLTQAGQRLSQPSATSVAVGIASAEYNNYVVSRFSSGVSAYSATGGALSVACGRLSYTFAFKGSAISVDTACSSSLVATHLAANTMWTGTALSAVAAGVGLLLNPDTTAMFHKAGMLAPDGRCKTLDIAADGYVRGEAAGVLYLKFASSVADSSILSLICGSAVNQDGRSSSLTAPNGPAQQEVIRAALSTTAASFGPHDVTHLQMHGTGTALGDPIEIGAAHAVLVDGAKRRFALSASTAKSWIGHTEAAAGVMGLTQASVGVSHNATLGIMHLKQINSHVQAVFDMSKTGKTSGWHLARDLSGAAVRTALLTGISSFAFQGTNAHALVRQSTGSNALGSNSSGGLWHHQRVWVAPTVHAVLQNVSVSTNVLRRQRQLSFEGRLNGPRLAFMWEHAVKDLTLLPASAYIDAAASAAGLLQSSSDVNAVVIKGVTFATPMVLRSINVPQKVI